MKKREKPGDPFVRLGSGSRKHRLSAIVLTSLIASQCMAEPDLILHHGQIVAVDAPFSIHEAMAIEKGRIVSLGRNEEVMASGGAGTEKLDLQGAMVLPGLLDSHMHPVGASMTEFDHPIPAMDRIQDVLDYIQARARVLPKGQWIIVQQVFITRLKEQRYPTLAELDQVAPDHPVMFRTGPDAALNTLALNLSGIDRDFKVTDGSGGFAELDPVTGEPTGILRNCRQYVKAHDPARVPTREERLRRLTELFADYNSAGLTSICDRDAGASQLELYQALHRSGQLSVRVSVSRHVDWLGPLEEVEAGIRKVAEEESFVHGDDWLRIVGIKMYLDGGMLTGSAYMRKPWGVSEIYSIRDSEYRGVRFIPPERLAPMVRTALDSGLQFTAHSVGDGAVHALLDAYEDVSHGRALPEGCACISHSNFMSREAVEKAARLGVMMDIQPAWLYLDTRTLTKQFGEDRLRYFQPLRSLFAAGAVAGGGSDHMQKIGSLRSNNPYNPFLGMATAITRRAKDYQGRLHPEEGLTREQALRFYTINNARILRCPGQRGSLEPGKLADFIVIDRDLLTCPEDQVAATQVLRTYVGGKLVWRAAER